MAASGLDYTIVRPGSLTDDPGTGKVRIESVLGNRDSVPRDDVAAVLAEVLGAEGRDRSKPSSSSPGDIPIPRRSPLSAAPADQSFAKTVLTSR